MIMMLALACKDPVDAETVTTEDGMDLNTLTAYLFREWDVKINNYGNRAQ